MKCRWEAWSDSSESKVLSPVPNQKQYSLLGLTRRTEMIRCVLTSIEQFFSRSFLKVVQNCKPGILSKFFTAVALTSTEFEKSRKAWSRIVIWLEKTRLNTWKRIICEAGGENRRGRECMWRYFVPEEKGLGIEERNWDVLNWRDHAILNRGEVNGVAYKRHWFH